ncbi:MAG: tRNA threonylcarbamoyladenosine biosynthesis protein RimN [Gammaproteobacteria bacterium]|nr:tRNA threonylcarbamoyladenosine biosynthesis protein RimN [Gammaproteobacteria bacterium]
MPASTRIQLIRARRAIERGGVIAYPTESVYGLGCDPFNADAVARLRGIKTRNRGKGFILIAATLDQILPLIAHRDGEPWPDIVARWPGPVTWIFDASAATPPWLQAEDGSIAVRVTAHPIAAALCRLAGTALVSTSANSRNRPPLRDALAVRCVLGRDVDDIVTGPTSNAPRPTVIMDARTGACLRA